jgi:hypothetical protein
VSDVQQHITKMAGLKRGLAARERTGIPDSCTTRTGGGFACPSCGIGTVVIDSRGIGSRIRRRRACPTCSKRFTTYELTMDELIALGDVLDKSAENEQLLARLASLVGAPK